MEFLPVHPGVVKSLDSESHHVVAAVPSLGCLLFQLSTKGPGKSRTPTFMGLPLPQPHSGLGQKPGSPSHVSTPPSWLLRKGPGPMPLPGISPGTLDLVSERVFLTMRIAKQMVLMFILGSAGGGGPGEL